MWPVCCAILSLGKRYKTTEEIITLYLARCQERTVASTCAPRASIDTLINALSSDDSGATLAPIAPELEPWKLAPLPLEENEGIITLCDSGYQSTMEAHLGTCEASLERGRPRLHSGMVGQSVSSS